MSVSTRESQRASAGGIGSWVAWRFSLAVWMLGTAAGEATKADAIPSSREGAAQRVEWEPVVHKGRSYVSFAEVAKFYDLEYTRDDKTVLLQSGEIRMEARVATKGLVLNGLQFYLSYPVLPWGERVLVSNFDLVTIIDPTMRPSALREPSQLTTIVLNPAHGGLAAGLSGRFGVEKDVTLELAKRVQRLLVKAPFRVVLTREGDYDMSLEDRMALANAVEGEAVFVSIHLGHGSPKASGFDMFTLPPPGTPATYDKAGTKPDTAFYPGNENDRESQALAVAIQAQAIKEKLPVLGLKRARFDELKAIGIPAVYCRAGFASNPADSARLTNPDHLEKTAKVIARGIWRYAKVLEEGLEQHLAQRATEPLLISSYEVFADQVRSLKGEKRRVRLNIKSQTDTAIDPDKLELQVFFFDLVDGERLDLSTADPPTVEWISVLPDWEATDTEVVEVSYIHPAMTREEQEKFGQRFYHGFVARLVYDGNLVDARSEPTNLRRALPHFVTVFP